MYFQPLHHPLSSDKPNSIHTSMLCLSMWQNFIWASLLSSLSKVNAGECFCISACMSCECENICKCVARLSNVSTASKPSSADSRGREVVSATRALAAVEVNFIKSCQCLEIKTTIFNPACVRVLACICKWAFTWVWDGTPKTYGGRNLI